MQKIKRKKNNAAKKEKVKSLEKVCPNLKALKCVSGFKETKSESEMDDLRLRFANSSKVQDILNLQVSCSALSEKMCLAKNYKISDLLDKLENSDEEERSRKPAFFQAIYYELKHRLGDGK